MKLNEEIKDRIDKFFAEISAEDLYRISVEKYRFTEDVSLEILNQNFENSVVDLYESLSDESFDIDDCQYSIALAA